MTLRKNFDVQFSKNLEKPVLTILRIFQNFESKNYRF
jgi:hypothetical protein